MRSLLGWLLISLCCTAALAAEEPKATSMPAATASQPAPETKVYKLTIHPAPEPVPALKYHLMPTLIEQKPGNAAPLYDIVANMMTQNLTDEQRDKIDALLAADLGQISRQSLQGLPVTVPSTLAIAAQRERCDWELPIREQSYDLLLPSLSKYRQTLRSLLLEVRLSVAEGRHDDALRDLQTGFAFAHHMQGPTLIQDLVSIAMVDLVHGRMLDVMGSPHSPNLYWALAHMPRPFVNLRPAMEFERGSLFVSLPALRDVENARLSEQEWRELLARVMEMGVGNEGSPRPLPNVLAPTAFAATHYSQAKKYLLDHGYKAEQVDQMPVIQVVLIPQVQQYRLWTDRMFRWYSMPFPVAYPHLREQDKALRQARGPMDELTFTLLPSLSRAYLYAVSADRQIAALQCIEAIRMYAAGHEGRLPATLEDIKEVPVPVDPVTNGPFDYTMQGNTCVLEAPTPDPQQERFHARYELTLSDTADKGQPETQGESK
jgi:hypothetical protein